MDALKFKLEYYTMACLKFAEDSKDWVNLPDDNFVIADFHDWKESWDNNEGGLYLDWAFKKSPQYIKENARNEFVKAINEQYMTEYNDDSCFDGLKIEIEF